MIQLKTNHGAPEWASYRRAFTAACDRVVSGLHAHSARIMSLLILVLVVLQLVLAGLMLLTGRYPSFNVGIES